MITARIVDDADHIVRVLSILVDRKGRRLASRQDLHDEDYRVLELERTIDVDGDGELEVLGREVFYEGTTRLTQRV